MASTLHSLSTNMQTNCLGLGLATSLLHWTTLHYIVVNIGHCGVLMYILYSNWLGLAKLPSPATTWLVTLPCTHLYFTALCCAVQPGLQKGCLVSPANFKFWEPLLGWGNKKRLLANICYPNGCLQPKDAPKIQGVFEKLSFALGSEF